MTMRGTSAIIAIMAPAGPVETQTTDIHRPADLDRSQIRLQRAESHGVPHPPHPLSILQCLGVPVAANVAPLLA